MSEEVRLLAATIDSCIDLKNAALSDEFYYSSVPLCIVDSVFSIGVRYEGVRNTVERFCVFTNVPRFRARTALYPEEGEQLSIDQFLSFCEKYSFDELATKVFGNRQRTSSTGGILKAQAVVEFARKLASVGISYFQDISKLEGDEDAKRSIQTIKGQGTGISYSYFLMLAGDDKKIKPDRMLIAFAEKALGRKCAVAELQELYSAVTKELQQSYSALSPRLLDYQVWNYQRNIHGQ